MTKLHLALLVIVAIAVGFIFFNGSDDPAESPSALGSKAAERGAVLEEPGVRSLDNVKENVGSDDVDMNDSLAEQELYGAEGIGEFSLSLDENEAGQLEINVSEVAELLDLQDSKRQILSRISREKALLDKNSDAKFNSLLERVDDPIWANANNLATEQELADLNVFESQVKEIIKQRRSEDIAIADKLNNLLTQGEKKQLEEYENSIIGDRSLEATQAYLKVMASEVQGGLTKEQHAFLETIPNTVVASGIRGRNHLGFSLQRWSKSSPDYNLDVKAHIIAAAEALDSILTYEQKTAMNFDINKTRAAFDPPVD